MRDRLTHLHQAHIDTEGFTTVELDSVSAASSASVAAAAAAAAAGAGAVGPADPELDEILQEAQQLRLEIQHIQNDIAELKDVNYQALNRTSYTAPTKRDSNTIGADIKKRAENVLQRLHAMDDLRQELEASHGTSDPRARIARTQYQCLSGALREVMKSYSDAEMGHKEACKRQIQRQMEVVGREASAKEVEEMMETGEWDVFSAQVGGKTARSACLQIESRHKELQELEKRVEGVRELFLDVAMLIEEQGLAVNNIQKNVEATGMAVEDTVLQLNDALAADRKNPLRNMFCCCFPCLNS